MKNYFQIAAGAYIGVGLLILEHGIKKYPEFKKKWDDFSILQRMVLVLVLDSPIEFGKCLYKEFTEDKNE